MSGDNYWRDGDVPHSCGLYIEEHTWVEDHLECRPRDERYIA